MGTESIPTAARHPEASIRALVTLLMLSGFAGITIGMLNVLSQLFAIRLQAASWQMGLISGAQSFAMASMTLPAGLVIARFGPRATYVAASLGVMLVYLAAPFATNWLWLLLVAVCGNVFIPYRIVAINGSFMERLKHFGAGKAGWYRGSQVAGFILIGPLLGTVVLERFGLMHGYWAVAAMFALMAFAGSSVLPLRPAEARPPSLRENIASLAAMLRTPALRAVLSIELSSSIVSTFFTAFIVLTGVRALHLSEPVAVSVRFFEAIVSVATLFFVGPLLRQIPAVTLYRLSLVMIVIGFLLLGAATGYWQLSGATLLLGSGIGIAGIATTRQLALIDLNKSKMASLQLLCSMTGGAIGGVSGGVLSSVLGLHGLFYFAALLYAVLSSRWCFPSRRLSAQPAT